MLANFSCLLLWWVLKKWWPTFIRKYILLLGGDDFTAPSGFQQVASVRVTPTDMCCYMISTIFVYLSAWDGLMKNEKLRRESAGNNFRYKAVDSQISFTRRLAAVLQEGLIYFSVSKNAPYRSYITWSVVRSWNRKLLGYFQSNWRRTVT